MYVDLTVYLFCVRCKESCEQTKNNTCLLTHSLAKQVGKAVFGAFASLGGGESSVYIEMAEKARETAFIRLLEHAAAVGGNGKKELVLYVELIARVSHILWVANGRFVFSSCYDSRHRYSVHWSGDCRGELQCPRWKDWSGCALYMKGTNANDRLTLHTMIYRT